MTHYLDNRYYAIFGALNLMNGLIDGENKFISNDYEVNTEYKGVPHSVRGYIQNILSLY